MGDNKTWTYMMPEEGVNNSFEYASVCRICCTLKSSIGLTKRKITVTYPNKCTYCCIILQSKQFGEKCVLMTDYAVCIIRNVYLKPVPFKLQIKNLMNTINTKFINWMAIHLTIHVGQPSTVESLCTSASERTL